VATARQQHSKHISAATACDATTGFVGFYVANAEAIQQGLAAAADGTPSMFVVLW
jgi:hypothetical protein